MKISYFLFLAFFQYFCTSGICDKVAKLKSLPLPSLISFRGIINTSTYTSYDPDTFEARIKISDFLSEIESYPKASLRTSSLASDYGNHVSVNKYTNGLNNVFLTFEVTLANSYAHFTEIVIINNVDSCHLSNSICISYTNYIDHYRFTNFINDSIFIIKDCRLVSKNNVNNNFIYNVTEYKYKIYYNNDFLLVDSLSKGIRTGTMSDTSRFGPSVVFN